MSASLIRRAEAVKVIEQGSGTGLSLSGAA
jgi:hypothetical protein